VSYPHTITPYIHLDTVRTFVKGDRILRQPTGESLPANFLHAHRDEPFDPRISIIGTRAPPLDIMTAAAQSSLPYGRPIPLPRLLVPRPGTPHEPNSRPRKTPSFSCFQKLFADASLSRCAPHHFQDPSASGGELRRTSPPLVPHGSGPVPWPVRRWCPGPRQAPPPPLREPLHALPSGS